MELTWYGHSCFRITERSQTTVVTDPYHKKIGLPELSLKSDVVTISHDEEGHNADHLVKNDYVLRGPGQYEIGELFIKGIAMHHVDEDNGVVHYNVAYLFEYPKDIRVLHLGDLAHVPNQSTIEEFGEVNVLLIPVGGGKSLRAGQAADVIALIEPYYIVPMHYQIPKLKIELEPLDRFLKAMGVSKVQQEDSLKIGTSDTPEQPQVIVLNPNI